jgi:hypothetical protein
VGVGTGDQVERVPFTDPVDQNVFQTAPVIDSDVVTRTFLLRGLFSPASTTPAWDHFDILEVDAMW